ncbi:hypothetical protein [Streptomyces europaeiscabiei]|uniref:hypothetical protein n=1 Tax=Streptomyces europaeiscabiei TaxID=146819 RepID=UPI0029B337CE|nr:hypothetical protein [Streptomyces europaeiscabiei]MDX3848501.1 hypothetical protein [Streptomyces europaeiscabiei]
MHAAAQGGDLLLHLTEWPQFSHVDPHRLAARVTTPKVIDGRGTLNPALWREADWTFRALGPHHGHGPVLGRTPGHGPAAVTAPGDSNSPGQFLRHC